MRHRPHDARLGGGGVRARVLVAMREGGERGDADVTDRARDLAPQLGRLGQQEIDDGLGASGVRSSARASAQPWRR
jgi:hypothetical protein